MPSTGWTTQPKQPINKTIGINKLGTLLSSQTTDTPGTTQTQRSRIAPEQLFKLTRTSEALQTSVSAARTPPDKSPHPYSARTNSAPYSRPFRRGSVAIFPLQRRRLELLYTPNPAPTNPRPGGSRGPNSAVIPRIFCPPARLRALAAGNQEVWTSSHRPATPVPVAPHPPPLCFMP
jgi:hypothetical protein